MTASSRVLIAGIGNVFLGDDGFGVAVAQRLATRPLRPGVRVMDFGIRGIDLAYELLEPASYDQVFLVDALPRGGTPGTLYVLEPAAAGDSQTGLDAHTVDPAQVLAWVRTLGGQARPIRVIGCEPARIPSGADLHVGLSEPVTLAVDRAVALVEELLDAPDA